MYFCGHLKAKFDNARQALNVFCGLKKSEVWNAHGSDYIKLVLQPVKKRDKYLDKNSFVCAEIKSLVAQEECPDSTTNCKED